MLDAERRRVGVVVEECQIRAPAHPHGEAGGQHDADDRAQALRPGIRLARAASATSPSRASAHRSRRRPRETRSIIARLELTDQSFRRNRTPERPPVRPPHGSLMPAIRRQLTRADLEALDRADPLARFQRRSSRFPTGIDLSRWQFARRVAPGHRRPRRGCGPREWGEGLIRSWNDAGWIDLAGRVAGKIATADRRARRASVAVGDSTSVNVFKLLAAALALRPGRRIDPLGARESSRPISTSRRGSRRLLDRGHVLRCASRDEIVAAIDDDTAVVMLTHVSYRHRRHARHGRRSPARRMPGARWCSGISPIRPARFPSISPRATPIWRSGAAISSSTAVLARRPSCSWRRGSTPDSACR